MSQVRAGVVERAAEAVREALSSSEAAWHEPQPRTFVVTMPGEHKQRTECHLAVGEHSLLVSAFVIRCPEENAAGVHRWLLERNARTYAVAFAVESAGDIYLVGRLPLAAVTAGEVDRVLGSVLEQADGSFDRLLRLGFAGSIRAEWAWRLSRAEPTANLRAFEQLRPPQPH